MHRLAAEHGVRVAALYRYWPSKDALLSALLERAVIRLRESLAGIDVFEADVLARSKKAWSAEERALLRLVRLAGVYLEIAKARPEITSLIAHFLAPARTLLEPAPDSHLLAHAMAIVTEVAGAFDAAVSAGALTPGPAMQRAALYWTSLQGLVASAKLTRFGIAGDRDALYRALVSTLLSGWGASSDALVRPLDRGLS